MAKVKKCKFCNGTGIIGNLNIPGVKWMDIPDMNYLSGKTCNKCHGKGARG